MKYILLAAIVALSLSACGDKDKVGTGKPGQYPPSLWDKRDSAPPTLDADAVTESAGEADEGTESAE